MVLKKVYKAEGEGEDDKVKRKIRYPFRSLMIG